MAALKLRHVGFAVAIDLGDAFSPVNPIHPRRKQEVGRRLALSELAVQYAEKGVVFTGPSFTSFAANANATEATVSFEAAGGHGGWATLRAHGRLKICRFQALLRGEPVRGAHHRWAVVTSQFHHQGQASRAELATAAARYAWEAWPQCSLYDGVGGPDDHTGTAATPWCWNVTEPCAY
jgi:hypothetical protein